MYFNSSPKLPIFTATETNYIAFYNNTQFSFINSGKFFLEVVHQDTFHGRVDCEELSETESRISGHLIYKEEINQPVLSRPPWET